MDLGEYVDKLLRYGGIKIIDNIYFKNIEDAENAKDWVDSIMLMYKLEEIE